MNKHDLQNLLINCHVLCKISSFREIEIRYPTEAKLQEAIGKQSKQHWPKFPKSGNRGKL